VELYSHASVYLKIYNIPTTPSASSNLKRAFASATKKQAAPPPIPKMRLTEGVMNPLPGVTVANPAIAPLK
jgi:hypothetical protein